MVFVTWTGKGFVTLFILAAAIFVAPLLYVYGTIMLLGDIPIAYPVEGNIWYQMSFYMLIVALATLPLGRVFLKEPQRETVNDRKTGLRHVIVTEHTVFDVNVRYHAYIFLGIGALCLLLGLLETAGILYTGFEKYL